ncbi:hypothetical protein NG744_09300 [Aliarcobacter cryaerophilus]|uniref:N-acyl amino acid synthase FeeM domain-containing protein n=1 Tax=Aliarcobacter cryaerophilus TaxID=28198 RepID=UPI003DA421D7
MTNINKNLALQELQKLLVLNFSKTLSYMSDDFNNNQKYIIELLTKRVFLEEIVEETISFNKKINWDSSLKNLSIVTNAEDLIKVFELRSDVYKNINYLKEFPDLIFSFDNIRKQYNKIGELSRLIVKHEKKGLNLEFKYLMKGAYLLFILNDIDMTFLGIKKEHYKLYERFGGSNIIQELDNYGNLDLDALILSWNPSEASDFLKKLF